MMITKISKLLLSACLSLPIFVSQIQAAPIQPKSSIAVQTLRGEAFYLERMALLPGATLHVTLVGRVAGAEYLPLATTIVPARSGMTPFELKLPSTGLPTGPYRIQAWIVGDNRVLFKGHAPQTLVESLDKEFKIRLSPVTAPRNIDGIGDGKPLVARNYLLSGEVLKLDRRALTPNAEVVIEVRDASIKDAPPKLLGSTRIELKGRQLPVNYILSLHDFQLAPTGHYGVSAQVFESGKLSYVTATHYAFAVEKRVQKVDMRVVSAHSSN